MTKLILLWHLLQNEVQQNKKNRSMPNNIFVAVHLLSLSKHALDGKE